MKMKQRKWRGVLLSVLGCLMLTGCGETPYELTEEEQNLIVSYSAHVVSKFNRYQKDGLTYVPDPDEELQDEEVNEPVAETEQPSKTEQIPESGTAGEETGGEISSDKVMLDVVFADTGLTFTYLGNEITASYMEDDSYAVNAGLGKTLLVLKLEVKNSTEEAVVLNNMDAGDGYSAKYILESGKTYNAKSVMTLLLNDFTTYEGTIEPQTAVEMIIVFEIPAETTSVDAVELQIQRNGKKFQINL